MTKFNVTPQLPLNGLTVLELFCGGGIGAAGFSAAGFNIVKALDFDARAVATYRHNYGNIVEQADICEVDVDALPNTDVIFGGPPCQDYSNAGNRAGSEGKNGKLVYQYLNIIAEKKPKAFVFENVKALVSKTFIKVFEDLLNEFEKMGYDVSWEVINSWDFGVAQRRERVFIVGIRKDVGVSFDFPVPLEEDYRSQVMRDVVGDLPNVSDYYYTHPRNYNRRGVFGIDETSPTIRTQNRPKPAGYPGHPNDSNYNNGQPLGEPRRFTVREALRIQSTPDSYTFPDNIPLTAQYQIVGNGIASKVAWYIGKALAEQLIATERGVV